MAGVLHEKRGSTTQDRSGGRARVAPDEAPGFRDRVALNALGGTGRGFELPVSLTVPQAVPWEVVAAVRMLDAGSGAGWQVAEGRGARPGTGFQPVPGHRAGRSSGTPIGNRSCGISFCL